MTRRTRQVGVWVGQWGASMVSKLLPPGVQVSREMVFQMHQVHLSERGIRAASGLSPEFSIAYDGFPHHRGHQRQNRHPR